MVVRSYRRYRNAARVAVVLALASAGCGGDAAPAGGGVQTGTGGGQAAQGGDSAAQDTAGLQREVFTYLGSGRDPFMSLVSDDAGLRPFVEDLRVTSILFDARYPARSVAVLRDVAVEVRYQVRSGDAVGRLRVTEIREHEVVLSIEEFGESRQVVLPVRRQEGDS